MATAKDKKTVTAEVPTTVVGQLDARAELEGRKRNEVINRALAFYLEHAEVEIKKEEIEVPKLKVPKSKKGKDA